MSGERRVLCGLDPLTWAGRGHPTLPPPNTHTLNNSLSSIFNLKPLPKQHASPGLTGGGGEWQAGMRQQDA